MNGFHDKIDIAFAGHPFLPNTSPTTVENRRRFRAYLDFHKALMDLCYRVYTLTSSMAWAGDWTETGIEDLKCRVQDLSHKLKARKGTRNRNGGNRI
jgi:hypothetical protein